MQCNLQQPLTAGLPCSTVDYFIQDLLLVHQIAQAVRAQQKPVTFGNLFVKKIRAKLRLTAKGPGDEVFSGVVAGLISCQLSAFYHILNHRVIPGDLANPALVDVVSSAVAYVEQQGVA
jgi:hypothetical protein